MIHAFRYVIDESIIAILEEKHLLIYDFQPGYFDAIGLFMASYVIPKTSGGDAASAAAHSTLSGKYTFADEKNTHGLLDIIPTNKEKQHTSEPFPEINNTQNQSSQRPSTAGSSESEWIEMSARDADMASAVSVKPQDAI